MSKLYISAGHGGSDPGAVKGSRREKDFTLAVANKVSLLLAASYHTVIQNRTADRDSKLAAKIKQANDAKVDAVIEIHLNAGGGTGCEVYHAHKGGAGKTLAEKICAEISNIGYRNRGAKTKKTVLGKDYFAIIRETKAPAVLVECCFLDNDSDMSKLNIDEMALAVTAGILAVYPSPKKTAYPKLNALEIGNFVNFIGGSHYASSSSLLPTGGKRTAGSAKITNIRLGAAHPYHLIGIQSNVYGWVDKETIKQLIQ